MSVRGVQILTALCASGMLFGAEGTDIRVNLLKEGNFKPVHMHDMVTAAKGWSMHDAARIYSINNKRAYLSGEECFKLEYADGVFSILFKKPLNPCYKHGSIMLSSRTGFVMPPADHYTIRGRLKFKNGKLELRGGPKFPASDDWQDFKYTLRDPISSFIITPGEGAEYHFAEAFLYAEYPEIGGSIALPDGGKLEKFLLPENASYELRLGVALWRGWLWKLTGVALPIETVDKLDGPVKGAFVAVPGTEKPGNWSLKVDSNGIFLSYGTELEVECAIFDYLRRSLGCAFYRDNLHRVPAQGSVKMLPALEFSARPHFDYFNTCRPICTMQGGADYGLLYTCNDVDYYHLPSAKSDHVFNVLVPQERYFDPHPEYFMDDGHGKHSIRENPHYTQHCMTNPEFMELLLKNAVEYAKAQYGPRRMTIDPGDAMVHCMCPRCVKFNGGGDSSSNVTYEYHDRLAKRIAEVRPEMVVERGAYASRVRPPDHIKRLTDNSRLVYCMAKQEFRCSVHTNCEVNRKMFADILELRKLVGDDPKKMSFMFYGDLRPLYMFKLMRELNKYGSDCMFFWRYRSFHPGIPFLLGRWNLGENPEKLLREFEEASYGKGAPFVHRAFEAAEEFAANYKHSPQDLKSGATFHIWPDNFGNAESVMDRPAFDKIHALFAQALKAAGKDRDARRNIYRDWLFFLAEDLNKYRAPVCRSDAELREFAKRLAIVVRMGEEFPGDFGNLMFRVPAREFLGGVTGVDIPKTAGNWADEPLLDKIVRNPEKHLSRGGERFAGSGIYFKPVFFKSSFDDTLDTRPEVKISAYRRDNLLLQPTQEMTLEIPLADPAKQPLMLSIEGAVQRPGAYPVSVAMNGVEFYRGNAPFAADRWTRMGLAIPPATLKPGTNVLRVKNLSSTAGWMAISEIYVIDISGDFRKFASGDDSALWREQRENGKSAGIVKNGGGKVRMIANKGGELRVGYFANSHIHPKIAVLPGCWVRMRVRASGRGQLVLRLCRYSPYELDRDGVQKLKPTGYLKHIGYKGVLDSEAFRLRPNPRTYSFDFRIPKRIGLIFPNIVVCNGEAEITDVTLEILPPKSPAKRK